jgi:hypothetical protein
MLTRNQNALYWREWSAVRKASPASDRHELHVQALGEEKSHVDFTNDDFDKVLAAFRAVSQPGNLNAQLHALNGQSKRLLFGILRLARELAGGNSLSGADYIAGIVRTMNVEGKLGSDDLEQLHPRELTKVMVALRKHEKRGCVHAHTSNLQRVGDSNALRVADLEPDPF